LVTQEALLLKPEAKYQLNEALGVSNFQILHGHLNLLTRAKSNVSILEKTSKSSPECERKAVSSKFRISSPLLIHQSQLLLQLPIKDRVL